MTDTNCNIDCSHRSKEAGTGLLEILFALVLVGIVSMAITRSMLLSHSTVKLVEVNYAASNLALSKVEELSAYDVADLDSSFSGTETGVAYAGLGITFTRVTTVTVNADDTRDIQVTVSSESPVVPTTAEFSTTFAVWE